MWPTRLRASSTIKDNDMSEYFFKVAELPVTVSVPAGVDLLALLPNMRPFAGAPGETVMRIAVEETDATRGQADAPGCVPTEQG